MAAVDDLVRARYLQTTSTTRRVVAQIEALWRGMRASDVVAEMEGATGRRILNLVIAGQLTATQGAEMFVRASMAALGATAEPILGSLSAAGFAGLTGDGRRLDTALFLPALTVAFRRSRGASDQEAMAAGLLQLATITSTALADTSRSATQVAMAANRNAKYFTRVVTLPACSRCILLAGRTYSYTAGFKRHPNCDCQIQPLDRAEYDAVLGPKQLYAQMDDRQRRRVFGVAGSQALALGAHMDQVVNARRGMEDVGEATTTEGTTVRGWYGRTHRRAGGAVERGTGRYSTAAVARLSPQEIFRREPDDRDAQVALLRKYAYLT
jgi:hypothetical protein